MKERCILSVNNLNKVFLMVLGKTEKGVEDIPTFASTLSLVNS